VDTKDILMHIYRANEVTAARKAAAAAGPISSLGLLTMSAARTPARCASFGAGEAQDAGLRGFVGEFAFIPLYMITDNTSERNSLLQNQGAS